MLDLEYLTSCLNIFRSTVRAKLYITWTRFIACPRAGQLEELASLLRAAACLEMSRNMPFRNKALGTKAGTCTTGEIRTKETLLSPSAVFHSGSVS